MQTNIAFRRNGKGEDNDKQIKSTKKNRKRSLSCCIFILAYVTQKTFLRKIKQKYVLIASFDVPYHKKLHCIIPKNLFFQNFSIARNRCYISYMKNFKQYYIENNCTKLLVCISKQNIQYKDEQINSKTHKIKFTIFG